MMRVRDMPDRKTLEKAAELMPEIDVQAVEVLVQFLQASDEIHHSILDHLERDYQLSEGKLTVMIILYQATTGLPPSKLAEKANVTRATISAMLRRMIRDGLAYSFSDPEDGRGKVVSLSEKGRAFLTEILPDHYLKISQVMNRLRADEQIVLMKLLRKIVDG